MTSGRLVKFDRQRLAYSTPDSEYAAENGAQDAPDGGRFRVVLPDTAAFAEGHPLPGAGAAGLPHADRLGVIVRIAVMDMHVFFDRLAGVTLAAGPSPLDAYEARVRARPRVGVHGPQLSGGLVEVGYEIKGKGAWIPLTGGDRPLRIVLETPDGRPFSIDFDNFGLATLRSATGRVATWKPSPGSVLGSGRPLHLPNGLTVDVESAVAVLGRGTLREAIDSGYGASAETAAFAASARRFEERSAGRPERSTLPSPARTEDRSAGRPEGRSAGRSESGRGL